MEDRRGVGWVMVTPPSQIPAGDMMRVEVRDGWYIVSLPKIVLALTREHFIVALQAGKRWHRWEARRARVAGMPPGRGRDA